jgi:DNA-binding NtrC family response regulator
VAYEWPGNIRELENVIERAVLFCDETRLGGKDLTPEVRGDPRGTGTPLPGPVVLDATGARGSSESSPGMPAISTTSTSNPGVPATPEPGLSPSSGEGLREQVRAAMARLERELIVRALQQTGNNVTRAARLLKISRKGLQLKMKELGLREQPS